MGLSDDPHIVGHLKRSLPDLMMHLTVLNNMLQRSEITVCVINSFAAAPCLMAERF
jgi:hypothetical protein